ncbi:hypothetical protein NPIL_21851, partial [Nephila pilipes]
LLCPTCLRHLGVHVVLDPYDSFCPTSKKAFLGISFNFTKTIVVLIEFLIELKLNWSFENSTKNMSWQLHIKESIKWGNPRKRIHLSTTKGSFNVPPVIGFRRWLPLVSVSPVLRFCKRGRIV